MSNSRFTDVINAARDRTQEAPQEQVRETGAIPNQAMRQVREPAKRGRPAGGKRNNPDYEQVAAYIPRDLNKRVKMRLLELDKPREFSELVEFLLKRWLQSGTSGG